MKMKHTQHSTLMDSLKEAISEQHARMEATPFIAALTDGKLPIESYVGLLRAMAVIHGTLDHELAHIDSGTIRDIMLDRPSRLVHLRKDLSIFDAQFVPDIEGAVTQSRRIAERIRHYRVEQPTDLLGILYVLEGTTLGNTVHLNDVLKTVGDKTAGQAHYYTGYGKETSRYWREFSAAMNALPMDQEGCRRLITVALDFFDQLEPLFSALYPLDNAVTVYSAGMLNPEAGDHTVPETAEELAAAVIAAKKCRDEFHLTTESELQGRLKRCGDLIVSAVCDHSAGISEAVGSLIPWLTDPERFSPEWISAVTKTLKQANNSVKGNEITLV